MLLGARDLVVAEHHVDLGAVGGLEGHPAPLGGAGGRGNMSKGGQGENSGERGGAEHKGTSVPKAWTEVPSIRVGLVYFTKSISR